MTQTFGENVRARRHDLGMTLQDVADISESAKSYIWDIEKDHVNISLHKALRVSFALKTNIYGLVGTITPNNHLDKPRKKRTVKKS